MAPTWRVIVREPLRPRLSRARLRQQRRYNSTASAAEAAAPPKRRISLRPFIYGTAFLALGVTAGNLVRFALVPPICPPPFTLENDQLIARITKDIDALDIVQKLRAASTNAQANAALSEDQSKASPGGDGQHVGWREVLVDSLADVEGDIATAPISTTTTSDSTITRLKTPITRTLTKESCAGARGFGVQRIFWNSITKELVAVVWFGGSVSGWPGLTHGGAIATIFTEGLSRTLAGPDRALDSLPDPSSLAMTYAAPTRASNFYILRACMSSPLTVEHSAVPEAEDTPPSSWFTWISPRKDLTKRPQGPSDQPTVEISGTLENLSGKVCVKAKATWSATAIPVS